MASMSRGIRMEFRGWVCYMLAVAGVIGILTVLLGLVFPGRSHSPVSFLLLAIVSYYITLEIWSGGEDE